VLQENVHEEPEGRLAGHPLSAPLVGAVTGHGAGVHFWLVSDPSEQEVADPTAA
jgi:hypothetical protein